MEDPAPQPPPRRRGWRKGQSGNPAGRPKGARHKAVEALDVLGRQAGADIVKAVISSALSGDARCAELVLRRIWPEVKGRPVTLELPKLSDAKSVAEAMRAITGAMAAGQISPDEAQAVLSVVEGHRRVIEMVDLDARLSAIEAKMQNKENP